MNTLLVVGLGVVYCIRRATCMQCAFLLVLVPRYEMKFIGTDASNIKD